MATPRKSGDEQRMVSRTYRAAIRIGEDFITMEETIALPLDASDEEVTQAVDLGWRIFRAQREAADAQVADIRSAIGTPAPITVRDPDSPASDKQRNYIVTLQDNLAWNSEHLAAYAEEQNVDLVTMTKGQASLFIDGLSYLFVRGIQRKRDRFLHGNEIFADADRGAVGARNHAFVAVLARGSHCPVLLPGRHGLVWLDRALLVFNVASRP